ncbi:hypothetical protein T492DRAFT_963636 [Pavlovales sp. CCMP2436]|nr:hypothetical protein T492DRAFT_963636 [Pavlovales sp. CCMP2436]
MWLPIIRAVPPFISARFTWAPASSRRRVQSAWLAFISAVRPPMSTSFTSEPASSRARVRPTSPSLHASWSWYTRASIDASIAASRRLCISRLWCRSVKLKAPCFGGSPSLSFASSSLMLIPTRPV